MTSDAKLGLVAGVVGVVLLAVVYHHKPAGMESAPVHSMSGSPTTPPTVPPAAVVVPGPTAIGPPVRAEAPSAGPSKRL